MRRYPIKATENNVSVANGPVYQSAGSTDRVAQQSIFASTHSQPPSGSSVGSVCMLPTHTFGCNNEDDDDDDDYNDDDGCDDDNEKS